MKNFLTILLFSIIQFSHGQACGKYNLIYRGNFKCDDFLITKIQLPTTSYLTDTIDEKSNLAFVETTIKNNNFNIEISPQLTNPINSKEELLSSFKAKDFKIKIWYIDNNILKEKTLTIDWSEIVISKLNDKRISPLFLFELKNIKI